ncbi:MAG: TetR/AcrR family transcriptional regulator, partial [Bacteroidota bacterium]|nr:TetR/AcrR family transcriptional regulator [Bacteroidota bacterium]
FTKGEEKRSAILKKALQMFNREGVEYVGVREIAAALQLRPSHVTYYFPTKEDMVLALSEELRALNDQTLSDPTMIHSIGDFTDRFRQVMKNHIRYRCLPLSLPWLLTQLPKVKAYHQETRKLRQNELALTIDNLVDAGAMRKLTKEERSYLIGSFSLISRGWLGESMISNGKPESRIEHYIRLIEGNLRPFLN